MKSLVFIWLLSLAVAGCVAPPQKSSHPSTRGSKPAAKPTLVDANWIEVYREMEHEHGDYKIRDDEKIVPVGDKFRVPPSVIRNFQDLSNAAH